MTTRLSVRRIAMTAHRLIEADAQLGLWDSPEPVRGAVLQQAIDRVSERWQGGSLRPWAPVRIRVA